MSKKKNPPPASPEKTLGKTVWQEVSWVLPAILLAIGIKTFIADVYSIPTGSMEPTLTGRASGGDRIFSPKCAYWFRANGGPNRWEPYLFRYPLTDPGDTNRGENFIKRCTGLPGEIVYLAHGDLYRAATRDETPVMLEKPLALQDGLWLPVHRQTFGATPHDPAFRYYWEPSTADGWTLAPGALSVETSTAVEFRFLPRVPTAGISDPPAAGVTDLHVKRQAVTFRGPESGALFRKTVDSPQVSAIIPATGEFVTHQNLVAFPTNHLGPPMPTDIPNQRSNDSLKLVGDLRLRCTAIPRGRTGRFGLEIRIDDNAWQAVISLDDETVTLHENGRPVADPVPLACPAGKAVELDFFRCDGRIVLRTNGTEAFLHRPQAVRPEAGSHLRRTALLLHVSAAAVDVTRIDIDRDIYYFFADERGLLRWPEGTTWRDRDYMQQHQCYFVPEGYYLAFGDNQPNSNDSRSWGLVPEANLIGPALFTFWPPHRARMLY